MNRPTSDPGPDPSDRSDDELEAPADDQDDVAGFLAWLRRGMLEKRVT
jgi:hypothetical protein